MRINKDTKVDELAPVKDTVKKLYDTFSKQKEPDRLKIILNLSV